MGSKYKFNKDKSQEKDGLGFNVEYCPIEGPDSFIEFKFWLKTFSLPICLLLIAIFVSGIIVFDYGENTNGLKAIATIVSTAFLTFFLVVFRENYNSANEKLTYFDGFMMEIRNNIEFLNANIKTACFENKLLWEDKIKYPSAFLFEPIFYVQFEFWELLKSKMSLIDLNMNISELERFVYDAHRYNEIINNRKNVNIFDENVLEARKTYNSSLITLAEYMRDEHLFNAMKTRGILIHLNETQMNKLKKDCKDACKFVEYLEKEEEKLGKFTSKNKKSLKKSFLKKPEEMYIFYYNRYGPVKSV